MQVASARNMRRSHRSLGCESLEERLTLSGTPPTVVDVSVASTEWSSAFVDHLEASGLGVGGYSIPTGSAAQASPLGWDNLDQIRITFSEDVYVDAADLALSGLGASYAFSDFDYRPEDRLAIWTLAAPLGADRFHLQIDADGIDPVTNLAGDVLDGDWINSVTTGPSGNGAAGGDFDFSFNVLPGDALGIGTLEFNDYFAVFGRDGQQIGDDLYLANADINGSGTIDQDDWQVIADNFFQQLPQGTPIGAINDAPTTRGFDLVQIPDPAADVALSLFDAFDDQETSDADLTFSVVNNSDPSLFESISIDEQTGELIFDARAGVSGRSQVTVAATDESGQTVETTVTVDVARENIPPSLTATATDGGLGLWTIEGWVTDPDDELDPLWVNIFGSIVDGRVSVAEDGYFVYTVLLEPGETDLVSLFVSDDESSSPFAWVAIG